MEGETLDMAMRIKPPVATSVGLWVGYRGYGGGYSLSMSGNKGINMSFNMSSPNNGINIRYRRFKFDEPECEMVFTSGQSIETASFDGKALGTPMDFESFVFDGYWLFNNKCVSLPAAYDQSTLQLRSAGSFIAGLMFYTQKYDFAHPNNFWFLITSDRIGKMQTWQGSLGAGYTYNWVPVKGLTLNAVVMPVITLFNHVKVSRYDIYPDEAQENILMTHSGDKNINGKVSLNLDTRVAASYWMGNWFISLIGQGQRFRYTYDTTTMKTVDWNVKASIGVIL